MAAPYRQPPTFRTVHDPVRLALWLGLRPVGPEHKLDLTTNRETGGGVTTLSGLPAIPVVLSTSSVYPERTTDAFETAARLGYDGLEVMVYTDPVSQSGDALARLVDYHQVPVLAVHAPGLLLTQLVSGREPWSKLVRAKDLAERLGAPRRASSPPRRSGGSASTPRGSRTASRRCRRRPT